MGQTSKFGSIIAFATIGAVIGSFAALAAGAALFGLDFNDWTEWQGRIVGGAGTVAGVVGAMIGLKMATRT